MTREEHFHETLADASISGSRAAVASGFSLVQIIQLLVQYGPQALTIAVAVAAAIKSASPVTALEALAVQYGPAVYQIAQSVAAMFGVILPAPPS